MARSYMLTKACFFVLAVAAAKDDYDACAASHGGCAGKHEADANTLIQSRVRVSGGLAPDLKAEDPPDSDLRDAGVDIDHMGLLETDGSEPTEHVPGEEIGPLELDEAAQPLAVELSETGSHSSHRSGKGSMTNQHQASGTSRRRIVASTEASHIEYGTTSSNTCPSGSVSITDVQACQAAASSEGSTYVRAVSTRQRPGGCFQCTSFTCSRTAAEFMFNVYSGSGSLYGRKVCEATFTLQGPGYRACSTALRVYDSSSDNPGTTYEESVSACYTACSLQQSPTNGVSWATFGEADSFSVGTAQYGRYTGRCYCTKLATCPLRLDCTSPSWCYGDKYNTYTIKAR